MFEDLKDLDKFLKICRKHGIDSITIKDVTVKFGEMPQRLSNEQADNENIQTDELSTDELLYYAVQNPGA